MSVVIGFERTLIGTVIDDQHAFLEAYDLSPADMESPQHKRIWGGIMELAPKDALTERTLIEWLRSTGDLENIGDGAHNGEAYIGYLASLADLAGLSEYILQVKDASKKRRLQDLGKLLITESRNGRPADEIMEEHVQRILALRTSSKGRPVHISDGVDEQKARVEAGRSGEIVFKWEPYLEAIRTKVPALTDNDFMVVVGPTGAGKTSLLRYEAVMNGLEYGKRSLFFAYENTKQETQSWIVSMLTGIDHADVERLTGLEDEVYEKILWGYDQLANIPLIIKEMAGDPLEFILMEARREVLAGDLDAIFVDGAYLIAGKKKDQAYDKVSNNTQGLRSLAQELHVPVICTTQYSRKGNEDRPPKLDDMLYAGENAARVVLAFKTEKMTPEAARKFPENLVDGKLYHDDEALAVQITGKILKQTGGKLGYIAPVKYVKPVNQFFTLTESVTPRRTATRVTGRSTTFTPKPKPEKK